MTNQLNERELWPVGSVHPLYGEVDEVSGNKRRLSKVDGFGSCVTWIYIENLGPYKEAPK
jgi:hypothetical protein